jgi:hypothetical protein
MPQPLPEIGYRMSRTTLSMCLVMDLPAKRYYIQYPFLEFCEAGRRKVLEEQRSRSNASAALVA